MTITDDHWLAGATRDPLPGGDAMNIRRCLVMHFTSGATALSSIRFWRSPQAKGASAHLVVDRDGHIYQVRPFNRTCGHAGKSRWADPKTGKLYLNINSCSIGVEFANAGDDSDLALRWTKLPLLRARHRNGGAISSWEQYTAQQIAAGKDIARALVQRYNLDDITGHDCIAPDRKNDPGPAFPMQDIREFCGFKGLPAVHRT